MKPPRTYALFNPQFYVILVFTGNIFPRFSFDLLLAERTMLDRSSQLYPREGDLQMKRKALAGQTHLNSEDFE